MSVTLEGYVDLLINGFLNIYTFDTSTNGEILGCIISIFCLFLTFNFLPTSLTWAIFLRDKNQIDKYEFKERWGALFEFMNTNKMTGRLYNLVFIIRRFLFVMLCFYNNENGQLLLAINIFINFIYSIFMASSNAFIKNFSNKQDLFNECIVLASLYWKMLYTKMVEKAEDQYFFAKYETIFILFYCFANLIIIIVDSILSNKKYFIYIYNLAYHKY